MNVPLYALSEPANIEYGVFPAPNVIEAMEWNGYNIDEIIAWKSGRDMYLDADDNLVIITLEGDHQATIGDFIICGVHGELYPCKPDIFALTYDEE